jgi:hypothetical protein
MKALESPKSSRFAPSAKPKPGVRRSVVRSCVAERLVGLLGVLGPAIQRVIRWAPVLSRQKVVAGPAGPVSCSSVRFVECFFGEVRLAPMMGSLVGLRQVARSGSLPGGRLPQGGCSIGQQVPGHRPLPAVWPNPSVKGTSRKRAAPYVER